MEKKTIKWDQVVFQADSENDRIKKEGYIPYLRYIASQLEDTEENIEAVAKMYSYFGAYKPKTLQSDLDWIWLARVGTGDGRKSLRFIQTQKFNGVDSAACSDGDYFALITPLEKINKDRFKESARLLMKDKFYNIRGDEVKPKDYCELMDDLCKIKDAKVVEGVTSEILKGKGKAFKVNGLTYLHKYSKIILSKECLCSEIKIDPDKNLVFSYEDGSYAVLIPNFEDKYQE